MSARRKLGVIGSGMAVLVLAACSDSTNLPLDAPQDPLVAEVIALGFRPDMIVDRGDHFLVEGDIKITKSSLRGLADPIAGPLQWRTTNIVALGNVDDINVSISGAENSWQTAIQQAISEWNAVHPDAQISLAVGTPADITFSMTSNLPFVSCDTAVIAAATFPGNGQPGPTVQISNQVTSNNCLNASQKKYNMVHEIGHTLGLRHTNWQGLGETSGPEGAWQIPGTPATDGQSVMNGATGLSEWNGFSTYDSIAAYYMYPPTLGAYIDGPQTVYYTEYNTWEAMPSGGVGDYKYWTWMLWCPYASSAQQVGYQVKSVSFAFHEVCTYYGGGPATIWVEVSSGYQSVTPQINISTF